jgi:serine/threonine protein kinase
MRPSDPKRNLVKLTSFSLAHPNDSSYHDDRRLFVPIRHCAPEIVLSVGRSNYSEYPDVYAMGVLMWQTFSKGKLPYGSSKTNSEARQRKLKGEKLSKPLLCDERILSIIDDCWRNEPEVRYQFKHIKRLLSDINVE